MKRRFVAACVLLLSDVALAQTPVIQISGANFRPLPVAVPAAAVQDGVARDQVTEFDQALMFDLAAAGIFQVLDRKGFLSDAKEGLTAGSIQFSRWSDVGAESLVKTQLSVEGGSLHGELRLFSVGPGKEEFKLGQSVGREEARKLAHTFSDALFRHFTHESGVFRSRIAFAKKTEKGKDIWLADWDGHQARAIMVGGINLLPAVTPEGNGVAFTTYLKGKPDLYVKRVDGTATPVVQNGQMATGIAYSRDGRRIAYSLAQAESAQIWVARPDGSEARQLTDTPFFINSSPTWSPDGKRLAFVSNRGGSPQVYLINVDGKEKDVRRLTFQGNYNQTPDWSPRGDLIAFTARDERSAFDLFVYNVDTGKISRLTQDQGNNEEPTFSPNGRMIMFTSSRRGGSDLFVMTPDGNTQTPLQLEKGTYLTPSWGPLPKDKD